MSAVILQSHRPTNRPAWIEHCLASVRDWALERGHDYRFIGDEMMASVPEPWRRATADYPQIAADLGRLHLLRDALNNGAETAIWLDADVLVHAPERFDLACDTEYAFGRELWIEADPRGKWRARRNVHNAVILMRPGNPVLAFYIHAAERILDHLARNHNESGKPARVPPQIIGPKLLGALHNIVRFPLLDDVAMISPPMLADIAAGNRDSEALLLFRQELLTAPSAVNLSASVAPDESLVERVISRLLIEPEMLSP